MVALSWRCCAQTARERWHNAEGEPTFQQQQSGNLGVASAPAGLQQQSPSPPSPPPFAHTGDRKKPLGMLTPLFCLFVRTKTPLCVLVPLKFLVIGMHGHHLTLEQAVEDQTCPHFKQGPLLPRCPEECGCPLLAVS
eukprot:scaffold66595_cov22-Tisochrysis_lutea.AAC.1